MRQRRWMHCCTCKAEPAEIGCKREKFGVFEMEIYFNLDPLSPFESVGFTNEQTKLMWLWTWRANDSTIKSFHSRQFYLLRSLIVLCASHRIQHSKGCCRLWKQSECERCSSSHSINKLRKDGVRRSRAAWIYHLMGDKPSRKSLLTHFAISLSLSPCRLCAELDSIEWTSGKAKLTCLISGRRPDTRLNILILNFYYFVLFLPSLLAFQPNNSVAVVSRYYLPIQQSVSSQIFVYKIARQC